jgi:fucose permease
MLWPSMPWVWSALPYCTQKSGNGSLSFPRLALVMMGAGYFLTGNMGTFEGILMAVFLAGLGLGLFIANLNFWVLELSPAEVRGKSMGTLTACLFLGQFSSPIIAEPIIRSSNLAFLFMSSLIVLIVMGITLTVSKQVLPKKL